MLHWTQKSKEIASEADERSQATAETLGNAHLDRPSSPHDHTGQQTYDQNPATPSPQGPGNPVGKHPGETICAGLSKSVTVLSPESPIATPLVASLSVLLAQTHSWKFSSLHLVKFPSSLICTHGRVLIASI